tara:strand:- start:249 stop:500 length:252 start_codon:yes stop_codon:yes gene_type:complete
MIYMNWQDILKLTPDEKEQVKRLGEEDAAELRHKKETDKRAARKDKRDSMGLPSFMGRGTPRSERVHRMKPKDRPKPRRRKGD